MGAAGWAALALAATLAGCAADEGSPGVTWTETLPASPRPPAPPVIPWLAEGAPPVVAPDMTCPDGWHARDEGGVEICHPYPAGGPDECGPGEAHFPGEPGCSPIGRACGDAPFAEVDDLDPDALLFVLADADEGGNGSREAPFRTLSDAVRVAPLGATVVVGAGRYEAPPVWAPDVSLRGRCVRDTRVALIERPGQFAMFSLQAVRTRPLRIENVGFDGDSPSLSPRAGIIVGGADDRVVLDGVEIRGLPFSALTLDPEAVVDAHSFVVRDMGPRAGARPVILRQDSSLTITRGLIEGTNGIGIISEQLQAEILAPRRVELTDTVIRSSSVHGLEIRATDGLQLTRCLIEDSGRAGLVAVNTAVDLSDVTIRDSSVDPNRLGALRVTDGQLRAVHLSVVGSTGVGIAVDGERAAVTLERSAVVDVRPSSNDADNAGVTMSAGGGAAVRHVRIERAAGIGLRVETFMAPGVVENLVVRDTRPTTGTTSEAGLALFSDVAVRRAVIDGSAGAGIRIESWDDITLEDVAVRGVALSDRDDALSGAGIRAGTAVPLVGGLTLSRLHIADAETVGLFVQARHLAMSDVVVEDTAPHRGTGRHGVGVSVEAHGMLSVERVAVARSHLVGVALQADFSEENRLSDLRVTDTRSHPDDGGGTGLLMLDGRISSRSWQLERIALSGSDGPALLVRGARFESSDARDLAVDDGSSADVAVVGSVLHLERSRLGGGGTCGMWLDGLDAVELTDSEVTGPRHAFCLADPQDVPTRVVGTGRLDAEREFVAGPTIDAPSLGAQLWFERLGRVPYRLVAEEDD